MIGRLAVARVSWQAKSCAFPGSPEIPISVESCKRLQGTTELVAANLPNPKEKPERRSRMVCPEPSGTDSPIGVRQRVRGPACIGKIPNYRSLTPKPYHQGQYAEFS